jgi:hypothetical protein
MNTTNNTEPAPSRARRRLRRYFDRARAQTTLSGISATAARVKLNALSSALGSLADDITREQLACLSAEEHGPVRTWGDALELIEGALSAIDGAREVLR